ERDPRGSSSWRQFTVLVGPPVRLTYGLDSAKKVHDLRAGSSPPIMHPFPPSRCAEGSWRLTWGSAPHPGSVACGDPHAPRRSLAPRGWRRLEQLRLQECEEAVPHRIGRDHLAVLRVERHARGMDDAGRAALDERTRRHVAI